MKNIAIAIAAAGLASTAFSQASLTGRTSTLRYNYVYGGGPDVFQDLYESTVTDLLASDSESASFFEEGSGSWASHTWGASVSVDISHDYSVLGPLGDFHSLVFDTASAVATTATGTIGSATMESLNPGNHTQFAFSVSANTEYRLAGTLALLKSGNQSHFLLQRWNGFNWETAFTTWSLPGLQGPFDLTAPLVPGDYRLSSYFGVRAFGNDQDQATGNYRFDVAQNDAPTTARIRMGRLDSGSVNDLAVTDGIVMRVCKFIVPNQLVAPIEVELETTTNVLTPSEVTYYQTSRMATSGSFSQQIDLYDYTVGNWSTTATRLDTAGTGWQTRSIVVGAGAGDIVGPAGEIKARYRIRSTGPTAGSIWCHETDLATWSIWP